MLLELLLSLLAQAEHEATDKTNTNMRLLAERGIL